MGRPPRQASLALFTWWPVPRGQGWQLQGFSQVRLTQNNNNSRKATASVMKTACLGPLRRIAYTMTIRNTDLGKLFKNLFWAFVVYQACAFQIMCFCYTFCHLKKGDNFSVTGIRQVYPFWFLLACGQKLMWSFFHTSKILEVYLCFWAFFQGAEERWTTLSEELLRMRLWSQPGPKFRSIWGTYKLHCYTASLNQFV